MPTSPGALTSSRALFGGGTYGAGSSAGGGASASLSREAGPLGCAAGCKTWPTTNASEHFGHLTFLPRALAGTLPMVLQAGHCAMIGSPATACAVAVAVAVAVTVTVPDWLSEVAPASVHLWPHPLQTISLPCWSSPTLPWNSQTGHSNGMAMQPPSAESSPAGRT